MTHTHRKHDHIPLLTGILLCMSDTVNRAVLGLNYTVASLLIHKIESHTYIMCSK